MTLNSIYRKLRKNGHRQYRLLGFCIFLSVFLISSFSFMYFGPTVQDFLPEGGDTRKMAELLLTVTVVGCSIFTAYASTLFLRYKSREYGIFMALGEPRKKIKRMLLRELFRLIILFSTLGILAGIPASLLLWKLFETFIFSSKEMTYRFGNGGLVVSLAYVGIIGILLSIMGRRFVNKSNIIDILRTDQKTEMVREIKSWSFPVGVLLIFVGLLLGLGLNLFSVLIFHRSIPFTGFFYLAVLVGIYLVLLSVVSQNRLKKNKKKFYKNIVSVSMMRFLAKTTTRNMCVIVLLLFTCIYAAFYGLIYSKSQRLTDFTNSKSFSMHYPVEEKQLTRKDIFDTAKEHHMEIQNYSESEAVNLVVTMKIKEFEDGEYITRNADKEKSALFFFRSFF